MIRPPRGSLPAAYVAALVLCFGGSGCASSIRFEVRAPDEANRGQPLYMMIRVAEGRELTRETYESAATRLFQEPPDPSVRVWRVVFPGRAPVVFSIEEPEDSDIAIYFFFTEDTPRWRVPLNRPMPATVLIQLDATGVEDVAVGR